MNRRLRARVLALFLIGTFSLSVPAWCCSCGPIPPIREAFAEADVVFAGTVTRVRPNWRHYLPLIWLVPLDWLGFDVQPPNEYQTKVYFEVSESFKGIDGPTVIVSSERDAAACGIAWEVGWEAIVYAYQTSDLHPPVATDACMRLMLMDEVELAALRSIVREEQNAAL